MNLFLGYGRKGKHLLAVDSKVIKTTDEMVGHVRLPKKVKQHPYNLRGY